jgi:ATP-dependent DNA ligase
MASFPELIGEAQTGKLKSWSIRVLDKDAFAIIQTTHGYIDGKQQTNEKIISEGKNIGKKNETTPLEQAISEARSAWIKKKESGYSPNEETAIKIDGCHTRCDLDNGNEDNKSVDSLSAGRGKGITEDVPLPMLAHDYNKRSKNILYPCLVQRKYDGTRCVAIPNKGLFSRNRKRYPHLLHIINEINRLPSDIILDGELYSDTLTFQEIVGIVKRETLKEGDSEKMMKIKFHVYDIINYMPYAQRYANLQMLFNRYKFKHLQFVATELCESEHKMKELHAQYITEGYEGIILRNKDGLYKNARSVDLQKYKEFFDDEYEVVDYKEGDGLESGCVIWVCKTSDGKIFNCRPRGTREERCNMFINGGNYIGKKITVRYQEKTTDGLPRFPVGITFRDYE